MNLMPNIKEITSSELFKLSTILVVEDDNSIRNELSGLLSKISKKTFSANNGINGLNIILNNKEIDLVITDLNMPEKNGIDMISDIRNLKLNLPIIVLTANIDSDSFKKLLKLNISDFIQKPFFINTTIKIIHNVLSKKYNEKVLMEKQELIFNYEKVLNESNLISKTDLKGNITFVNKLFCEISGYSEKELLGKNHNILKTNIDQSLKYKELWKTITSSKIWKGTLENRKKNGDKYYIERTVFPIIENNVIKEYISVRHLISDHYEDKKKLKNYIKEVKVGYNKNLYDYKKEIDKQVNNEYLSKYKKLENIISGLNEEIKGLFKENIRIKDKVNFKNSKIAEYEKEVKEIKKEKEEEQNKYLQKYKDIYNINENKKDLEKVLKIKNIKLQSQLEEYQKNVKVLQDSDTIMKKRIKELENMLGIKK